MGAHKSGHVTRSIAEKVYGIPDSPEKLACRPQKEKRAHATLLWVWERYNISGMSHQILAFRMQKTLLEYPRVAL